MEAEFPGILKDGFDAIVEHLERKARERQAGFYLDRLGDVSPASYLGRFEPAIRERQVEQVVLVSDGLGEDLVTAEFIDAVCERIDSDDAFSFHAFIGILDDEETNRGLEKIKVAAARAPGRVELTEIGMKPLLQGLFTNTGGLCRGLEQGTKSINRVMLFEGVDLTAEVLEFARSYLRFDKRHGRREPAE
jgi:hypothetical protein